MHLFNKRKEGRLCKMTNLLCPIHALVANPTNYTPNIGPTLAYVINFMINMDQNHRNVAKGNLVNIMYTNARGIKGKLPSLLQYIDEKNLLQKVEKGFEKENVMFASGSPARGTPDGVL